MKGKILPLKIVVRELKEEEKKTATGLIVFEKKKTTLAGEVIMTGEGTPESPMHINIGDKVLFTQMAGVRFHYEDEELILLDQSSTIFIF